MKEDVVTQELIEYHSKWDSLEVRFEAERRYEHYGTRGAVDLWAETYDPEARTEKHYVYEVKSDAALRHATGANEILRQFTKMRDTFYRDRTNPVPGGSTPEIFFILEFAPTPACVRHVREFRQLYEHVPSRFTLNDIPVTAEVRFHRPPEELLMGVINRQHPGESLSARFGPYIDPDSQLGRAFAAAGVPLSG